MKLEEMQQHYDWSQYCVVVGQEIFCDVKDYITSVDTKNLTDTDRITINVYAIYSLDEILPSSDRLIDELQSYFDDYSDSLLSDETVGLDELAQAYQQYLDKNKNWETSGNMIKSVTITGKELKEFKEQDNESTRAH
jgi:hypothetical protein